MKDQEYIMHCFKSGSKKGFDLMFDALYVPLYHFAVRLIGSEDDAKDIVMVVIEVLFKKHTEFETFGNVRAFSFVSVKNKCLTYLQYREKFADVATFDMPMHEYIEAQMIRAEFLQMIYHKIEGLPPMRKKVFKLFYIDGLSIPEISKCLKIAASAVSNNKLKALNQLKAILITHQEME